jgi:hypothetical protein
MPTSWLRFAWDLAFLPDTPIVPPKSYILRSADKSDASMIQKVTASAFHMDSSPGDLPKRTVERMDACIDAALETDGESHCVVLQHGSRIIGCSALRTVEGAENHLLTGPCIVHEYRSRSFGTLLLQASLLTLRQAGLTQGFGVVRDKTTSARFVYPKFNGQASPWVPTTESPAPVAA